MFTHPVSCTSTRRNLIWLLLSCDCKMTIGAGSMWTSRMVIVICRRLAYTYTCAHVRIHANFVSLHSLTAQDRLYARSSKRSACAWKCSCSVKLTALAVIVPRALLLALLRSTVGCPGLSGILRFSQAISRRASASDCGLLLCCCTLWHSDRPIQQASDHCRLPGQDQVRTCVRSRHRENGDSDRFSSCSFDCRFFTSDASRTGCCGAR